MSVIGVPMLLGPILGPIIGGAIVDQVELALDLLVNLPSASSLVARLAAAPGAGARLGQRLDRAGAALLSPGHRDLPLRPVRGRHRPAASPTATLVAARRRAVLVALFVWHALRPGARR